MSTNIFYLVLKWWQKRQTTNTPFAEVLELLLQDDGEELTDVEYGDLSEDEEALINERVDPGLDLAEQR